MDQLPHNTPGFAQECVVQILAPMGRDSDGAIALLEKNGVKSQAFHSMADLCPCIGEESGVLLLTEEAFTISAIPLLKETLERQPLWSDLPVIILTKPDSGGRATIRSAIAKLAEELGNVMFLERPLHSLTLVSAVRAGLKARKRQYQSRDYLIEREQAAEQIRESELRFRTMADASPMMICLIKPDGQLSYINSRIVEFTGDTEHDVMRSGWGSYIHPEDFPATLSSLNAAIQEKGCFEIEFRCKRFDGYRWLLASGKPVLDPQGDLVHIISSSIDITERKLAQDRLRDYASLLESSNRELEHFATIASHDLQAPLRKVQLFSEMLEKDTNSVLSQEGQDYMARMRKSISRMQQLIADLLNLSRVSRHGKPFTKVRLMEIVQNAMDDLIEYRREVNGMIELKINPELNLFGDSDQLHQVFQNLIENALKFHRKGVQPVVVISAEMDEKYCEITVSDNGIGIHPENSTRIFETFQRLHGQDEFPGTGMGLSIVRKIVERHNGNIAVTGKPGEGCDFVVKLPVLEKSAKMEVALSH